MALNGTKRGMVSSVNSRSSSPDKLAVQQLTNKTDDIVDDADRPRTGGRAFWSSSEHTVPAAGGINYAFQRMLSKVPSHG